MQNPTHLAKGADLNHPLYHDVQLGDDVALRDQLYVRHEQIGAAGGHEGVHELGLAGLEQVALLQGL